VPIADPIVPTGGTALETPAIHSVAPPRAVDEQPSVIQRLEDKNHSGLEELKPPAAKTEPAPAASGTSRPVPLTVSAPPSAPKPTPLPAAKPAPTQAPSASATQASRPAGPAAGGAKSGYVVQLAATNSRSEADAMAKRLNAKGYDAYVQTPADNAPAIFRVRVGNYPTRSEAETAAARLEKEGKFKPWVAAR
jgi:cell division septation protein DedD